jgi:hypothetical protein
MNVCPARSPHQILFIVILTIGKKDSVECRKQCGFIEIRKALQLQYMHLRILLFFV